MGISDLEEVIRYVLETRKTLFPMLNHQVIPKDLQTFSATYIDAPIGAFLQARTPEGLLVGTIGMMAYNHRFPYFSFGENNVVEVVKLFVKPAYRKSGLGAALVKELKKIAQQQGADVLYLHTHPFLEGAYEFWLKQGFDFILGCEESGFETWHMALDKSKVQRKDISNFLVNNL